MRFSGKVAAVTGAAVGIGRAVALKFAQEGAKVVALDVNAEKLALLAEELKKYTQNALTLVCDVSDEEAVNAAFATAREAFGGVDILVNNAALWRDVGLFKDTPISLWKKYIDINLMGAIYCTHAALRDMLPKKYGRIINVSSVVGVYGRANMAHYGATKAALINLTRSLAREVAKEGILVNCVSPGSVSPAENEDLDFVLPSDLAYIGRTGSDNENANVICFLAGDEASYVSGQNIQIDGCRKSL